MSKSLGHVDRHLSFFGLARCGNHAVLNWICRNASNEGVVAHVNNISARKDNNPRKFFKRRMDLYIANSMITLLRKQSTEIKQGINKNLLVTSYEDKVFKEDFVSQAPTFSDDLLGVLLLRDPFNLIASREKAHWVKKRPHGERHVMSLECWKSHARVFLDPSLIKAKWPKVACINFSRWFEDPRYRKDRALQIGIPTTDLGVNDVIHQGSSFDKHKYHGNAQKMRVLERYKNLSNERAQKILADSELMDLANEIFPKQVRDFCKIFQKGK